MPPEPLPTYAVVSPVRDEIDHFARTAESLLAQSHLPLGWDSVNGVAKAYRTTCLREIGGLPAAMGWDSLDEYMARARGWNVRALPELTLLHYRRRGTKQAWWRARWEEGRGDHFMGYRPSFLA